MFVVFYSILLFGMLFFLISFFKSGVFNKGEVVNLSWSSPYECGFASNSLSFNCFSFTYFSLLVFFVMFDLEISLLLNMPEQGLLFDKFCYYYAFLIILCVSFVGEILMGYVRWGY